MRSRLLAAAAAAVVGALAVLLAASQQWGSATAAGADYQRVSVTGRQVSAALPALAVALVALAVAVVAARGLLRRLVANVAVAVAVTEVLVAVRARDDVGHALSARVFGVSAGSLSQHVQPWWMLAAGGGAVAVVAFTVIAAAGRTWHGMGARYDAPQSTARRTDPATAAWEALDRGDDPTA
jgi:uncharacterized membrane protein (TIGR02234 family)